MVRFYVCVLIVIDMIRDIYSVGVLIILVHESRMVDGPRKRVGVLKSFSKV